jgi:glycosyltransferase involved in cell wall biosynthesis
MDVSVAICTRDRATSLGRTLESLSAMIIPDGLAWEVVVVNNASRDDTDAAIARFRHRLPVRREYEAAPGLSNARNCAVATVKGAYVIWTDDDVIVDRLWLSAYVRAFQEWPDAALFGGKIIPLFEEPMPDWLRDCWRQVGAYALRDFGNDPLPITPQRDPFGANFAVRTREQRIYRYNPSLGLGAQIPTGEESDVIVRMLEDGLSGYWVPAAMVRHCVSRDRQTLQYLSTYYQRHGWKYGWRRISRDGGARGVSGAGSRLLGLPPKLVPQLIASYCRYQICRWTTPSRVWMRHFAAYGITRGELDFHRRRDGVSVDTAAN